MQNKLNNKTDIKIFILFLLDNINYPVDDVLLSEIVMDAGAVGTFDFQECLSELVDIGHVFTDEVNGMKYYMISDRGHAVAEELYEDIDPSLRERSLKSASRLLALQKSGVKTCSSLSEEGGRRYRVSISAEDPRGDEVVIELKLSSRARAESIKAHFDSNPQTVYRALMSSLTGEIDFLL